MASTRCIRFRVFGEARPGGSKKAFRHPSTGRIIVTDDSGKRGKTWRQDVQGAARDAYDGPLLTGPLRVTMHFRRLRPKGHFGTGRNADRVKSSAPHYPTTRPDVLKLARAVEDALSGLIYKDDAQIVREYLTARWCLLGERPGVDIEVEELGEDIGTKELPL